LDINNLFNNINNNINKYGISEYNNNLETKINNIEQDNIRILNNDQIDNYKTFYNNALDGNFNKLLNSLKNIKIFVNSFEKFEEFENKILFNILNLKISYDSSKYSIKNNNIDIDSEIRFDKLDYLNNIMLNYYNSINESYYNLKNYISESIYQFDILLNQIYNETYEVLINKYKEILNESESFEETIYEFEEKKDLGNTISISQNGKFITNVYAENIQKKVKFKYNLEFGKQGLKGLVSIYNQIRPEKVIITINSNYGTCGAIVEEIIIYFKNINYTTYIDFSTNSTDIISTIIANFDKYTYSTEKYEIIETSNKVCNYIMNIPFCVDRSICQDIKILEGIKPHIVKNNKFNKTIVIIP
jgi:hypothetical protein